MNIFWVFFSLSFPNLELGKSYQSEFSFLGVFYACEQEGIITGFMGLNGNKIEGLFVN